MMKIILFLFSESSNVIDDIFYLSLNYEYKALCLYINN